MSFVGVPVKTAGATPKAARACPPSARALGSAPRIVGGSLDADGSVHGAKLAIGGQTYKVAQRVAAGSFGAVYRFEGPRGAVLAVKFMHREVDGKPSAEAFEELSIIRALKDTACDVIQAAEAAIPAGSALSGFIAVVMPYASGDLRDFLAGDEDLALRLAAAAAETCRCLARSGFLYTDVKADNFMYFVEPGAASVDVVSADLGSICPDDTPADQAIYTVVDDKAPDAELATERDVVFGLAVMAVQLCTPVRVGGADWWQQLTVMPMRKRAPFSRVWRTLGPAAPPRARAAMEYALGTNGVPTLDGLIARMAPAAPARPRTRSAAARGA